MSLLIPRALKKNDQKLGAVVHPKSGIVQL
jgi:hypothetical protein